MKYKKIIEVTAESYEEEQYLLNKFSEEWWDNRKGKIVFYVPESKMQYVEEVFNEYKGLKKRNGT